VCTNNSNNERLQTSFGSAVLPVEDEVSLSFFAPTKPLKQLLPVSAIHSSHLLLYNICTHEKLRFRRKFADHANQNEFVLLRSTGTNLPDAVFFTPKSKSVRRNGFKGAFISFFRSRCISSSLKKGCCKTCFFPNRFLTSRVKSYGKNVLISRQMLI
jgi:hypothetical protein